MINKILTELDGPALDGKIFLVDVPIAIDLKTKEKGESAI
jgi:nitrogen regulatory protein PII